MTDVPILVHRDNEVDMLQKIFGESEEEEEEEEEGAELRPQKQLLPLTDTTATIPPPKTRKPLKRKREEGSLTPPEIAATSPPPTTEALCQVTPPQKPVAPPTPTLTKEEPKRPMFKSRGEEEEEKLARRMRDELPDKEDVAMFRLALGRLKEEGVELVGGVSWAHYPHDILSFLNFHLTIVSCPGPSHLGEVNFLVTYCHVTTPSLSRTRPKILFCFVPFLCTFLTPPTFAWSPAHQAETAGGTGAASPLHGLCQVRGLLQDRRQRQGQVPPSPSPETETQ